MLLTYKNLKKRNILRTEAKTISLNDFDLFAGTTGKCKISDLFEELGLRV